MATDKKKMSGAGTQAKAKKAAEEKAKQAQTAEVKQAMVDPPAEKMVEMIPAKVLEEDKGSKELDSRLRGNDKDGVTEKVLIKLIRHVRFMPPGSLVKVPAAEAERLIEHKKAVRA